MKYLFFDIECSNCFNGVGKMCEYGYVLCDEKLNVIKSGDIPMSPGRGDRNRFYLKGRKHEKDLELAYEYDYYYEQHEFPHFYKQIKTLMEDPDTICFAYSMDNDIPHLYHACRRYNLDPINYECCDVQKLVAWYLEKKGQMSLHNACMTIVGPNSTVRLQEHLSRDDAMMEKLILEAIATLTKKTAKEIVAESTFARTNSIAFFERVKEKARKRNRNRTQKTEGQLLYDSLTTPDSELDEEKYKGRRYTVSAVIKNNLPTLKAAIEIILSKNGVLAHATSKSDFFVVLDEENKNEITGRMKYPFQGTFILYEDLVNKKKS